MKNLIIFFFMCFAALAEQQKPNILFIFSDDHSLQTLGTHNGRMKDFIQKHKVTPNLDKLAEQGMYFENSFVCNSICGPSRAAILTGKHSWHNGFKSNGHKFDGSQWTMPKAFQAAGYETVIYGKWHLSTTPTGFDTSWVLPGQGKYYNPDFRVNGKKNVVKQGYCTDVVVDMTLDWLKNKRDKNKPFFLCSWQKAPHRTWMPAPRHYTYLDNVDVPEPSNMFDNYGGGRNSSLKTQHMDLETYLSLQTDVKVTPPFATSTLQEIKDSVVQQPSCDKSTIGEFDRMTMEQRKAWDAYYVPRNEKFRSMNLKGKELIRWKYQQYLKDYLRCIKALDENVGRLMAYLKESGLDKNTIVIYSSDQGFYNGEHGWYDKRWMYEESLRNPFIIKYPGVTKPGSRVQQMIQNIDYAPTLLDVCGIDIPKDVQGASFKPILEGKSPENWRKDLLYTYYGRGAHNVASHYGIRTERYKLIHFPKTDEWEMFDLKKDKNEMTNLYSNPEHKGKVQELKKGLKGLLDKYDVEVDKK
ncbi:MAG: sulfatase [Lentisphaerales bacterium]|nr:sulfatase [Lentisphaerales bacterium]